MLSLFIALIRMLLSTLMWQMVSPVPSRLLSLLTPSILFMICLLLCIADTPSIDADDAISGAIGDSCPTRYGAVVQQYHCRRTKSGTKSQTIAHAEPSDLPLLMLI